MTDSWSISYRNRVKDVFAYELNYCFNSGNEIFRTRESPTFLIKYVIVGLHCNSRDYVYEEVVSYLLIRYIRRIKINNSATGGSNVYFSVCDNSNIGIVAN